MRWRVETRPHSGQCRFPAKCSLLNKFRGSRIRRNSVLSTIPWCLLGDQLGARVNWGVNWGHSTRATVGGNWGWGATGGTPRWCSCWQFSWGSGWRPAWGHSTLGWVVSLRLCVSWGHSTLCSCWCPNEAHCPRNPGTPTRCSAPGTARNPGTPTKCSAPGTCPEPAPCPGNCTLQEPGNRAAGGNTCGNSGFEGLVCCLRSAASVSAQQTGTGKSSETVPFG